MVCTEVERSTSIAGGFVLVPVASLVGAWRACRSRPLGIGDFRAWLAAREMLARRCTPGEGRAPAYAHAELARLLGVTEKRARASLGRLGAAGLIAWSDAAIGFPDVPEGGGLEETIGRGRGSVAIPRRMLRLLAGGARPALIATALGILLRCLSRRRGGFDGRGRVKASWVANVFGVDERRVKAARKELVALGWIAPEACDQKSMNRWGACYRIDLAWDRVARRLPPPPPADRPAIATPSSDPDPLPEREIHQEPAGRGTAGARLGGDGETPSSQAKAATDVLTTPQASPGSGCRAAARSEGKSLPAPSLDDVKPEDLRDTGRTLQLYDQAVARKLVARSEDGRLKFVAVAEHARSVGTTNPGGLFARLVGRGWWHFASLDDEDLARRRLREHLHGRPRPRRSPFEPDEPAGGPASLEAILARLPIGRGITPA